MTVKTTASEVRLQRPKVRGTEVAFASRLLGTCVTRTNALESLVIAGFVRGLSVRDVEATLADALGPGSTVSKSTVSRICEAIKTEFDDWRARDLSAIELDYLFADGSYFKMHPGSRTSPCWWPGASPVRPSRCSWAWSPGPTSRPRAWSPGPTSRPRPWAGFFRNLKARGLRDPLLVISDGGNGLIAALETVFCLSLRQKCLIHRGGEHIGQGARPCPGTGEGRVLEDLRRRRPAPWPAAQAVVRNGARSFASQWRELYPAPVESLEDDFQHLITYLRFPVEHSDRVRHSNFIPIDDDAAVAVLSHPPRNITNEGPTSKAFTPDLGRHRATTDGVQWYRCAELLVAR